MTTSDTKAEDPDYDGAYRRLFEHPALLFALLALCARDLPPLARALARPLNTTFLTQNLQRKHADCIWELPLQELPGHALFVLVEFQSTTDLTMTARVICYAALLALHRYDTRPRLEPWPPLLLPIVIYNGKDRWSSPTALPDPAALPRCTALTSLQLHGAFDLLDLGHHALPTLEEQPDNLALTLFHMEQATLQRDTARVGPLFDHLALQLEHHPDQLALRRAFLTFFHAVLTHRGATLSTQRFETLQEAKTMFAHFKEAARDEGLQRGRREGLQEATLLLLQQKFGANADPWRARLATMTAEELHDFFSRAARATSLDDLND